MSLAARRRTDRIVAAITGGAAAASFATTIAIVYILLRTAVQFLGDVAIQPRYDIWSLVFGTAVVTVIALVCALPFCLAVAVYLAEFCPPRTRFVWKPVLELAAAVPSIVYGYCAIAWITPALQRFFPGIAPMNAIGTGIALGLMVLPVVATLSEDALSAVPLGIREAAYALGASRWQTFMRVVLPAASPGIAVAVLLGIARATGETMIIALACGFSAGTSVDPRGPLQTMTGFIAQVALGDIGPGSLDEHALFAVAFLLFGLSVVLNTLVSRLRRWYGAF